jgi:hypothetical protein
MNKELLSSIQNYKRSKTTRIYQLLILKCLAYIDKYRRISIVTEDVKSICIFRCLKVGLIEEKDWEYGHNFFIKKEYESESHDMMDIENEIDDISCEINGEWMSHNSWIANAAAEYTTSNSSFY